MSDSRVPVAFSATQSPISQTDTAGIDDRAALIAELDDNGIHRATSAINEAMNRIDTKVRRQNANPDEGFERELGL